jgi:hypothetical protein
MGWKSNWKKQYYLKNTATLNKEHYADHLQGYGKMWVKMEYKTCLRFEVSMLVKIHIVFFLVMISLCFCVNPKFLEEIVLSIFINNTEDTSCMLLRISGTHLADYNIVPLHNIRPMRTIRSYTDRNRPFTRVLTWTCALRTNTVRRTSILRDLLVSLLPTGTDTSKYSSGVCSQCLSVAVRVGDILVWCERTHWKYITE